MSRALFFEGINASFKARLTNVNYRYIDHELIYLLDNSDTSVVIYQSEFQAQVDQIRDQLPGVKQWLAVNDGDPSSYEAMVETGDGCPTNLARSPEDLLFLYTGGTTGMSKGVMWQHHDLFTVLGAGGNWRGTPLLRGPGRVNATYSIPGTPSQHVPATDQA